MSSVPEIAQSEFRLPSVISDNMVLQCDRPVRLWGWARPGDAITVGLCGRTNTTVAAADGAWHVELAPMAAGGPFDLTISGPTNLTLRNVLIGEVWLASGQSNMAMGITPEGIRDGAAEIQAADYPRIRLFTASGAPVLTPAENVKGQWLECNPANIKGFSAVAYFFGRDLHKVLDKPVGLIVAAWPGTHAESWVSRTTLEAEPELRNLADPIDAWPGKKTDYEKALAEFEKQRKTLSNFTTNDTGWEQPGIAETDWKPLNLPGDWETAGLYLDGVVWVRRTIRIPEAWAGKPLDLNLGPIEHEDVIYFNGVKVGESPPLPRFPLWPQPQQCRIPGELVKPGPAVIAIRITDKGTPGGLVGEAKQMRLKPAGSDDPAGIGLAGPWLYRISELKLQPPRKPLAPDSAWMATSLYNGLIRPLNPFAVRGVIWYQGEANAWRAEQYRTLFPALIKNWRKDRNGSALPFLFVQLPGLRPPPGQPQESDYAELREAQAMTLRLPDTGMAVTLDLGDANDAHPKNKQDVGFRLARWALGAVYGQKGEYSGPLFKSIEIKDGTARITFDHIGSGLVAKDGALKLFSVAGADRKFIWADARIDGNAVLVSSSLVPHPAAVRYAWADNPDEANLFNADGFPAAPFRTDNWPGITTGRK